MYSTQRVCISSGDDEASTVVIRRSRTITRDPSLKMSSSPKRANEAASRPGHAQFAAEDRAANAALAVVSAFLDRQRNGFMNEVNGKITLFCFAMHPDVHGVIQVTCLLNGCSARYPLVQLMCALNQGARNILNFHKSHCPAKQAVRDIHRFPALLGLYEPEFEAELSSSNESAQKKAADALSRAEEEGALCMACCRRFPSVMNGFCGHVNYCFRCVYSGTVNKRLGGVFESCPVCRHNCLRDTPTHASLLFVRREFDCSTCQQRRSEEFPALMCGRAECSRRETVCKECQENGKAPNQCSNCTGSTLTKIFPVQSV
jgi:hypothetical protein